MARGINNAKDLSKKKREMKTLDYIRFFIEEREREWSSHTTGQQCPYQTPQSNKKPGARNEFLLLEL